MPSPQLIIFSGLPGTGKTTLAKQLAARLNAVYLRADTIETALKKGQLTDIGGLGYMVAYAIAKENPLDLGNTVIADSVNPWQLTRDAWHQVATDSGKTPFDVQTICSDQNEHRKRIEQRHNDIEGHKLPSWQEVLDRDYHPWTQPRLQIDTAKLNHRRGLDKLIREMNGKGRVIFPNHSPPFHFPIRIIQHLSPAAFGRQWREVLSNKWSPPDGLLRQFLADDRCIR